MCNQFMQFEQCSIVIDSDEDIDGGFSCLLDGNTKGMKISKLDFSRNNGQLKMDLSIIMIKTPFCGREK